MGYAYYTLPDGREAGYGVEATCEKDGCAAQIDRGLGYLCGDAPDGHRDPSEFGCGNYFCSQHTDKHDCPAQRCDLFSVDGDLCCSLLQGHDGEHQDGTTGEAFTKTEGDDE